ncbi:MAG: hypothetical protein QNJ94_23755 [Alphaproteobacteria bacterium]|nr:hypothetical protein [Alphaproteobacteria bacterium]
MARGDLPTSFERRGSVVGFNHDLLRNARLRITDEYDWEVVIPNYQAQRAQLVLDWDQLLNFTSLGDRDRALYQAINALDEDEDADAIVDPFVLRATRIKIDKTLGESDEVRRRARREEQLDRQDRMMVYLSFLAQLTRDCGAAHGDTFMANATTDLLMRVTDSRAEEELGIDKGRFTDSVLAFAAEKTGIDFKVVNARLEFMSDLMATLGAINADLDGRSAKTTGFLARSRRRLEAFRTEMLEYRNSCRTEMVDPVNAIAFAAKQYMDYVDLRTCAIEQKFSNFMNVIEGFQSGLALVRQSRRDVSFALDGWSELIDVWDVASGAGTEEEIEQAVGFILDHLPLMPQDEHDHTDEDSRVWNGYDGMGTAMVRMMTNWGDGQVDEDLQRRIEAGKKRAEEQHLGRTRRGRRRRQRAPDCAAA